MGELAARKIDQASRDRRVREDGPLCYFPTCRKQRDAIRLTGMVVVHIRENRLKINWWKSGLPMVQSRVNRCGVLRLTIVGIGQDDEWREWLTAVRVRGTQSGVGCR